jgi:hypothetical protein
MFLGSRAQLVCKSDKLTTICADCLDNVGFSTSHNSIGVHDLARHCSQHSAALSNQGPIPCREKVAGM